MTTRRHSIDEILRPFFTAKLGDKKGLTRRRIEQVERHLRTCLESEAERILVASDLAVLAAERQFDPAGAVARVMHADDLLFVLTIFVGREWQPADPVQRRVQLRLTGQLTDHLERHRFIDRTSYACPLLDIRVGIDRRRVELRQQQRQESAPF